MRTPLRDRSVDALVAQMAQASDRREVSVAQLIEWRDTIIEWRDQVITWKDQAQTKLQQLEARIAALEAKVP